MVDAIAEEAPHNSKPFVSFPTSEDKRQDLVAEADREPCFWKVLLGLARNDLVAGSPERTGSGRNFMPSFTLKETTQAHPR